MGKLNSEQRNILREFLEAQGLSFKPLRDEMMDHLSCDVEDRMRSGISFEEAWVQSVGDIPDHLFKTYNNRLWKPSTIASAGPRVFRSLRSRSC